MPDNTFTFKDTTAPGALMLFTWSFGDRSQQTRDGQEVTYQFGDTGTYKVNLIITDRPTGCKVSDSVNVTILYVPGYLQVPNAVCPGCSNMSLRQFLPLGKGLKEYRLRIFTTWGQQIFETTLLNPDGSPKEPWNVQLKGNRELQQDTYMWQIEARYINGTEWKGMVYPGNNKPVKSGFITVLK